jgi:hypothetical protein
MISDEQSRQHAERSPQPRSLVRFFSESLLVGVQLDLERDWDERRDIEL